jgi:hypothetical protein
VEVFGRDSCRLSAVDKFGEVMGSVVLVHSTLLNASETQAQEKSWRVFPSPTRDLLTIRLEQPPYQAAYQMVNTHGAVVRSGKLKQQETQLNVEGLAAGVYSLLLTQGKRSDAQRVVVAR